MDSPIFERFRQDDWLIAAISPERVKVLLAFARKIDQEELRREFSTAVREQPFPELMLSGDLFVDIWQDIIDAIERVAADGRGIITGAA